MRAIHTLIKREEYEIDALRTKRAELQRGQAQLIEAMEMLAAALTEEKELTQRENHPLLWQSFGAYSAQTKEKRERLMLLLEDLKRQEAELEEALRERFTQQKTYEQIESLYREREAEAQKQKETKQLDELAILRHARKE